MEYTVNLSINEQNLSVYQILSVNGTVDIIRCNFTFEGWDDFPARLAIFQSKAQRKAWVSSLLNDSCLIPWEALTRAGEVQVALVGTNTDGQVQRTETKTVVLQKQTLQGGVNSIDPTPDQYAQFIAQVEEIIGQAGVLSVNGMTGVVTLTYSDVGALPDSTTIPTKTSQLQNDSGFLTSAPVSSVNGQTGAVTLAIPTKVSQLQNDSGFLTSAPVSSVNSKTGAVSLSASDVGALPDSTTIPTKVSQLQNDSGFITSAPVTSVNSKTGAVTLTASDVGALADTTTYVSSVNGSSGAVTISTATTSSNGLMSSTDKSHLDSVYADYSSALAALGV